MDSLKTVWRVSCLAVLLAVGAGARAEAATPCEVPGNPSSLSCFQNPAIKLDECKEVCTQGFCIRTDQQNFLSGKAGLCVLSLDARTKEVTGSQSLGLASFGRVGLDVTPAGEVGITVLASGSVGRARLSRTAEGKLEVVEPLSFRPPLGGPPQPPPEGSCTLPGRRGERFGCTGKAPSPEVFEKARAACVTPQFPVSKTVPPQGACSALGCLVVVPQKNGALDAGAWCPAWVDAKGDAHRLPEPMVYGNAFQLDLRGDGLCAQVDRGCQNREACLTEVCYDAAPPHRLKLSEEQTGPLESDGAYFVGPATAPVKVDGKLDDAAWSRAREVVGETPAQVRFGAQAWSGPADASIRLKLLHDADGMLLAARVRDDRVIPLANGVRSLGTDHLELDFGRNGMKSAGYALLLGADRKVSLRQWRDRRGRDVDWPLEAECAWAPEDGGYAVECRIPNGVLFLVPAVPGGAWFSFWVSDADRPGKQETLMGPVLNEDFVSAVPPTLEEMRSVEEQKEAKLP